MATFISEFVDFCRERYPALAQFSDLGPRIENTISPEVMPLERRVYERIASAIAKIYKFAHSPEWLAQLSSTLPPELQTIFQAEAPPSSVLMAYDFHYDPNSDRLGLIEINTNASMFLPTAALYEMRGLRLNDSPESPINQLKNSFEREWSGYRQGQSPKVAIVDEDVLNQRMNFEFHMYKDLFHQMGWSAEVVDVADLEVSNFDFVYNRFVDFYLAEPRSQKLRAAWLQNQVFLSPHPREYLLLADKERLIDFYEHKVDECFLETQLLSRLFAGRTDLEKEQATEDLWARRKQLFFKPRNMYGGKAAFRGNSISRRVFNDLITKDFVAQEFQPAAEFNGRKFDLRFFVYQDEIQLACARLYTGQTTNFNSPGGGLAPLSLV
jgi:hypothetical protein